MVGKKERKKERKKESDEVRVCGDFSVTFNACANVETYPMPQIEDMHSALRG